MRLLRCCGVLRNPPLPCRLSPPLPSHVRCQSPTRTLQRETKRRASTEASGSGSHLPFWKAGSGHYGNTLGPNTRKIVMASADMVLSAIDTVAVRKGGMFTFGDYGTNDGYSSMPLIERVIEHQRKKHGEDLAFQIVYEDQEKNDFNSLFNRLNDPGSYLHRFNNVYPLATNLNFYKRCVPDNTCDVIFSSIANHWMEKADMKFKDCAFDIFATPEEQQIFRQETERDWTKFLTLRAKELKPGGILVAINACSHSSYSPGQRDITPTKASKEENLGVDIFGIVSDLDNGWRQLRDDKIITEEEFQRCTGQLRFRNEEEIRSPFERSGSPVVEAGLRLEHYDEYFVSCVFKGMWREHQEKDTEKGRAFFADWIVAAHQVWTRTTFYSALSEQRSPTEKAAIMEELFEKRFRSLVMSKDPESYKSDSLLSRVVARKV